MSGLKPEQGEGLMQKATPFLKKLSHRRAPLVIFILWLVGYGLYVFFNKNPAPQKQKTEEVIFEEQFDSNTLIVKRLYDEKESHENQDIVLNIIDDQKSALENYPLPLREYGLEGWDLNIDDVKISKQGDHFRIILFAGHFDEDYDGMEGLPQHIWFLNYSNRLKLAYFLSLSGMNRLLDDQIIFFGNHKITLQAVEDLSGASVVIPILVRVTDKIIITPMYNEESKKLVTEYFIANMKNTWK